MTINIIALASIDEQEDNLFSKVDQYGKLNLLQKEGDIHLTFGVKKAKLAHEDIRHLGGMCRKKIRDLTAHHVMFDLDQLVATASFIEEKEVVHLYMEGWYSAEYRFTTYKKEAENDEELTIEFKTSPYEDYAFEANTRVQALNVARDLCNEPANQLTPPVYAKRITEIFQGTKVGVEIIQGEQLKEEQFEAVAMVGKGSEHAPKLAILTLNRAPSKKRIALVGKGVTFDSGGINAKTGGDIGEMKMDMGGSAAVVGSMKLLADSGASVNVVAIIPLVENVADGGAFLPSDVITYRNGMSVEVGNTDAEGRLVLADGILYAEQLKAETIIDIATLTGTIGQALGLKVAGIFSNQEEYLWNYRKLGEQTGDHVWPMPVIDDYNDYLKSDTADINNMSSSSFGGAITAALFLKNFVPDNKKWIHIDMANTVRPWRGERGYYVAGASGFGVRLLTDLVLQETENMGNEQ